MNDATTSLLRALRMYIVNFMNFTSVNIDESRSRSWASGTFVGVRHAVTLTLSGEGAQQAADAFVADLEEAEFALRGHILASIALVSRETNGLCARIAIEALTVEDA